MVGTPGQIIQQPLTQQPQPTTAGRISLTKREQRRVASKAHDEFIAANNTRGSHDAARTTPAVLSVEEQRQAKEQLMYALHLTSSTLNEVRRQVQETNEKPAFEERRKTR